jgi:Flp pilus assembly pilin Flp
VTALYVHVRAWFDWLEDQVGATAVEYALMLFLIAMVVFAAVQFLGRSTSNAFSSMTFTP